jgi:VDE lipocalin domain
MPILALPILTSFTSYFVTSYVVLPVIWWTSSHAVQKYWYDVCPVVKCFPTIIKCVKEPQCADWLNEIAECNDSTSNARRLSSERFRHVQHPDDAAYCQYQSFDNISTTLALEFVECIGRSGCIKPATHSDVCADMSSRLASVNNNRSLPPLPLPMMTIPSDVLEGTWHKVYTTGWDLWNCQWTDFWSPDYDDNENAGDKDASQRRRRQRPKPDEWMTEWPTNPNVWRMDLYWQNDDNSNSSITFHMNNEMHFDKSWNYSDDGVTKHFHPPFAPATLRTRAVMWGTEAHENWYLLDYHAEWQMMMVYYCAHTSAVDRFDSMIMILKRHNNGDGEDDDDKEYDPRPCDGSSIYAPTQEQHEYYTTLASELLGEEHGGKNLLQLINPRCNC